MKRFLIITLLIPLLISACGETPALKDEATLEDQLITVYKLPT